METYVSKQSIIDSIKYFKGMSVKSGEQLGLFLLFKHLGTTTTDLVKTKALSSMEKKEVGNAFYRLGGLFSLKDEMGGNRTCLFPFSFKTTEIGNNDFYNGGTKFKSLTTRLNDTVDNTLIDLYLTKVDKEWVKFKYDYASTISSVYLQGNKISLVHLSSWICRDIKFETPLSISSNDFTRMCIKYTKEYLKLREIDNEMIFEDDSSKLSIIPSDTCLHAREIRNQLLFKPEFTPEVTTLPTLNSDYENIILNTDKIRSLIEMTDLNPSKDEILEVLDYKKQIILYGVPGIGKSRIISEIQNEFEKVKLIQFHASTTYEEFIGGETIDAGTIKMKPGVFLEFCVEALSSDSKKPFLFIIDELNRANVAKVFGETIMTLDREYEVDLTKPIHIEGSPVTKFRIPPNVHIIATMNSSDRSITSIDFALRRRFAFVKLSPNHEIVSSLSNGSSVDIGKLFTEINKNIYRVLNDERLLLGQSYFLPKKIYNETNNTFEWTDHDLRINFNYFIIPTIEEYTFGSTANLNEILGEDLPKRNYNDEDFIKLLLKQFPNIGR